MGRGDPRRDSTSFFSKAKGGKRRRLAASPRDRPRQVPDAGNGKAAHGWRTALASDRWIVFPTGNAAKGRICALPLLRRKLGSGETGLRVAESRDARTQSRLRHRVMKQK